MFTPPYPKPNRRQLPTIKQLFLGANSWLDVLIEKNYTMKIAKVNQLNINAFLVNDVHEVRKMLVEQPDLYPKHRLMHEMLEPLLGESIFTTNGEVWARQRRLIDTGFSQARLKMAFPLMTSSANEMIERLRNNANDKPFTVDEEMTHVTADVIFRAILSERLSADAAHSIFKAFNDFQQHALHALTLSILRLPTYFAKRASKRDANKIRPWIADVIARRYKEQTSATIPHAYNDILEGIMQAVDPVAGDKLSYEEMVDQICMLFLAGHETTASALTWSLYLISQCKDMQQAMYSEIQQVAANRPIEFDDIKKLNLITNVFKEALRLYPPVGFFSREATTKCTMLNKEVQSGATMMIFPWLIQRHSDYWEKPHEFNPERFETSGGKESCKHAYLPFGKGSRVCTGQSFAMQEAVLILASIVRAFEIGKVEGHIPKPVGRVTIRPDNGVKVTLKPRVTQ